MCIKISPMQDLRIHNSSAAEVKIYRNFGYITAREGAAGVLLLHTCLHEKTEMHFLVNPKCI